MCLGSVYHENRGLPSVLSKNRPGRIPSYTRPVSTDIRREGLFQYHLFIRIVGLITVGKIRKITEHNRNQKIDLYFYIPPGFRTSRGLIIILYEYGFQPSGVPEPNFLKSAFGTAS